MIIAVNLCSEVLFFNLIGEYWRKPLFNGCAIHSFSLSVVFNLVTTNLLNGEVVAVRIGEIETTNGASGGHCK